jgi:hypothetical protein
LHFLNFISESIQVLAFEKQAPHLGHLQFIISNEKLNHHINYETSSTLIIIKAKISATNQESKSIGIDTMLL